MPNASVGPALGQRPHAWYRKLAYSLSRPCQKGEFALSASKTGSHGLIRSSTATPSSAEEISTWTWHPQVSCSCAVSPNARAISRYRPSRTSCGSTGAGEVPSAAIRAPARPATSAASDRHRRSSSSSTPTLRIVIGRACPPIAVSFAKFKAAPDRVRASAGISGIVAVAPAELLHPAGGVDHAGLAGVERVAR